MNNTMAMKAITEGIMTMSQRTVPVLFFLTTCFIVGIYDARAQTGQRSFDASSFVTSHAGLFNGKKVEYTARLAETVVSTDEGDATASIYSTDYIANVANEADRPIIFMWNGGPIAASQMLHMAGFGPKRLIAPSDVDPLIEPPFAVKDNVHTLLDIADLVFVDPAGTGFSRVLSSQSKDYFYSTKGDAESIAQFIRNWLATNGRKSSPVFIAGTSYGSIRAAAVAGLLAETDTQLEGAILFSQGVNLVETTQRHHNLVGYASNMSQLAAIAWFHGRTAYQDKSVFEHLDEANAFAMSDYLVAIAKGRDISDQELRRVAKRLAAFTGMDASYYIEHTLLVTKPQFRRDFMKKENMILAAGDARYAFPADAEASSNPTVQGVPDVLREHLENFLRVDLPLEEYRSFAQDVEDWDYGGSSTLNREPAPLGAARSVFADFDWSADLVKAFEANPSFRLFIGTGVYDSLTTAGPARLLASDIHFPGDRVERHEYEGGHSFYSDDAVFKRLTKDLRAFIEPLKPAASSSTR